MALVERRAFGRGMAVIAPERPRSGPLVANVRERDAQARMDAMAAELAALRAELARHEERTEGLSAEQTQKRAVAWREAHPEAWRRIRADGARAAAECRRFSMKREVEQLRAERLIDPAGEPKGYLFNNSYTAPLTRMLLAEVPELKGYVRTRKSKVDKYYRKDGHG